jgi:hypothetical protein
MRRAALSASAVSASYSDGNSRYDLSGGISVNVLKSPQVVAGFVSEYRDFSERKANGYFNPPNIFSARSMSARAGSWISSSIKQALATRYENKSEYATVSGRP